MALQLAELYAKNFYGDSVTNNKPHPIADNKIEWIIGGTLLIIISKADGRVLAITLNR